MLQSLEIHNFVIIKEMKIVFNSGFNVISGETGSGKSLIMSAISFALGQRITPFPLGPFSDTMSVCLKLRFNNQDLTLFREVFSCGKSQVFLNDEKVSLKYIKTHISAYFDICRQESQLITEVGYAQHCLDLLGGVDLKVYDNLYQEYQAIQKELGALSKAFEAATSLDAHMVHLPELKDLNPCLKEYHEMEQVLKAVDQEQEQQKLLDSLNQRFIKVSLKSYFVGLLSDLEKLNDPSLYGQFYESYCNLLDVQEQVHKASLTYYDSQEHLKKLEKRLHDYHIYIKRFGSLKSVVDIYQKLLAHEHKDLQYHEQVEQLKTRLTNIKDKLGIEASIVSVQRMNAIKPLTQSVQEYLKEMYLEKIQFDIKHHNQKLSSTGWDHFQFIVNINQHDQFNDFNSTASGGEKARFQLALTMALAKYKPSTIHLFDEIDTGVSGRVAGGMGQSLKHLSQHSQVIAITHQAPVASYADQHITIFKNNHKDGIMSQSKTLEMKGRQVELALMMSGQESSESLKLASELLKEGAR